MVGGRRRAALAAFCLVAASGLAAFAATPLLEPHRAGALQYLAIIIGTLHWTIALPASLLVRQAFAHEIVAPPLTAWTPGSVAIAPPLASMLTVTIVAALMWALVAYAAAPALRAHARISRVVLASILAAFALTLLQIPYLVPDRVAPMSARVAAGVASPVAALLGRAGVRPLYRAGAGYHREMTLSDSTAIHVWATTVALFLLFGAATALQR